jgi:predicted ATPase
MLEICYHNKRNFHFVDGDNVNQVNNIFTVVVGKNGTGKSRLLSAITQEFISNNDSILQRGAHDNNKNITRSSYTKRPSKVIATSTSPFDRFPIARRNEYIPQYSYLGLRDLSSQNFGIAYMSKIISSLLEAVNEDSSQMQDIANVLHYLGYSDNIRLRFEPRLASRYAHELFDSDNPVKTLENIIDIRNIRNTSNLVINRRFFYLDNGEIDNIKVYRLLDLLKNFNIFGIRKSILFELTKIGFFSHNLFDGTAQDIIFLMNSGVIRLREVTLEKLNSKAPYSISDASSGEQSVVLGFLGIASQIENNALICIDEPEICLHPEWQERYIRLLISTFQRYIGCHFIIATHSPQIISKLESSNCFILSMDSGTAANAADYINNSIDFQLANVFKSPGFKNEYLARIALNIFAKASANRSFDDDDTKNLSILLGQEKLLETSDPVYLLLTTLKAMRKEYARHK